jgi:hypothetical protein
MVSIPFKNGNEINFVASNPINSTFKTAAPLIDKNLISYILCIGLLLPVCQQWNFGMIFLALIRTLCSFSGRGTTLTRKNKKCKINEQ